MEIDRVLEVDSVSKVFCRDFKRSLLYGLLDITNELLPTSNNNELRKKEFFALKDISFHLSKGECLGLIGSNGSGKSTILRIINRLYKPDSGEVRIKGNVAALIALGTGFNPLLTGRENIYINGAILGIPKHTVKQKEAEIIEFSGIESFIDTPIRSYSSGMVVRLGFAVASILRPQILILDEVLAVGDIAFQHKCLAQINKIKDSGTSTILVSHNMYHISQYADRCIWIENGTIKLEGNTKTVCNEYLQYMDQSVETDHTKKKLVSTGIYGTIIGPTEEILSRSIIVSQNQMPVKEYVDKSLPLKIDFDFEFKINCDLDITFNLYQLNGLKVAIINNRLDNFKTDPVANRLSGGVEIDCSPLSKNKYVILIVIMDQGKYLLREKIISFSLDSEDENTTDESIFDLNRTWSKIV